VDLEELQTLVARMVDIGSALSSTRELGILLEMIVDEARRFTNADGGTLFLVDDQDRVLRWAIIQNETMGIRIGGNSSGSVDETIFRPIPLEEEDGTPELDNVATYVANTGEPISIGDVYDESDEFDFEGPLKFDQQTGYRTRSMLVVPLVHFEGGVIGVLQLINARDKQDQSIPFEDTFVGLTSSLAGQAAVAVKNAQLFQELELQFEAFIRTIATAIDAKSAYTAGHVKRVVDIAMSIAYAMDRADDGPFASKTFSRDEFKALKIASWMHDVGKIATPEYVVDKATKLETIFDRVEIVRLRYQLLHKEAECQMLRAMLAAPDDKEAASAAQKAFEQEVEELRQELAFIEVCNRGAEFMADDKLERLEAIASKEAKVGEDTLNRLTEDELYNLSIRKGTLTKEEITVIRDHAKISYRMLAQLPFSRHLASVPEIAAGHHEKLNGKGYPRGLTAEELSTEARILAVADIFEALTAADRPYKSPTPLSRVKRILDAMVDDGELDPDIVHFAMKTGVFDEYVEREVSEHQRDLVFTESLEP
jgi:HD-GYP domain-containing protein (c-di-GMP phosphodiesterase class II)